ncbi:MAG: response regulator [Candidatus Eisenbacteria bacterium]
MTVVLIVEGEPTLRNSHSAALRQCGYHVITACDFADALAMNLLHRPDVIVMDPGLEGRGLDVALEMTRVNKDARVVFHTRNPYQIGRDFSAWVADAMAEKSEDPSELLVTLRHLAAGAAERSEKSG